MFVYGLSRKQCGVIFAAEKRGDLKLPEDFCRWMYNRVSDCKVFADDSKTADVFSKMRSGLDAVFAKDLETASSILTSAYDTWHTYFSEI